MASASATSSLSLSPLNTSSGPTQVKRSARMASLVVGILAIVTLITSAFLLAFVRDRKTVTTVTNPSAVPNTSIPIFPPVTLRDMTVTTTFNASEVTDVVKPVASVGDVVPSLSFQDTTPVFPPGLVPFPSTILKPLQEPSEGFGYVAMLPNAQQFSTGIANGYSAVAQFNYDKDWSLDTAALEQNTNGNRIYFSCPTTGTFPINTDASAVGTVGHFSIAYSNDGLRQYVAYRQPFMGSSATSQIYPFLQLIGRVAVFTRPIDNIVTRASSSETWTYDCTLSFEGPFGAQVGGLDGLCDPITHLPLTSDDFGSIIRTSVNLTNGNRMTAARANFGYIHTDGALIAVYEEGSDGRQAVGGIVQLYDHLTGGPWTMDEKLAFGKNFDIGDDALLAAVRVPTERCFGATGPAINQVAYFERNPTTLLWDFKQMIPAPAAGEDFGVSIRIKEDGNMALIGAPTFPSGRGEDAKAGIGGKVYVYTRDPTESKWSLKQTFENPLASTYNQGAFGYWISTDNEWLVACISMNQDNSLDKVPPIIPASPTPFAQPHVLFVSIDQENQTLISDEKAPTVPQPRVPGNYIDPTFGANAAMNFADGRPSAEFRAVVNSPVNQTVQVTVTN